MWWATTSTTTCACSATAAPSTRSAPRHDRDRHRDRDPSQRRPRPRPRPRLTAPRPATCNCKFVIPPLPARRATCRLHPSTTDRPSWHPPPSGATGYTTAATPRARSKTTAAWARARPLGAPSLPPPRQLSRARRTRRLVAWCFSRVQSCLARGPPWSRVPVRYTRAWTRLQYTRRLIISSSYHHIIDICRQTGSRLLVVETFDLTPVGPRWVRMCCGPPVPMARCRLPLPGGALL